MSGSVGFISYMARKGRKLTVFMVFCAIVIGLLLFPTFGWTWIISADTLAYSVFAYVGLIIAYSTYIERHLTSEDLDSKKVESTESALTWGGFATLILSGVYFNVIVSGTVLIVYLLIAFTSPVFTILAFMFLPLLPFLDFELAQRTGKSVGALAVWMTLVVFHLIGVQKNMTTERFLKYLTPKELGNQSKLNAANNG